MTWFQKKLEESVIIQALITLMTFSTICYLYVTGKEVPDFLVYTASGILGFYFGQKTLKGGK